MEAFGRAGLGTSKSKFDDFVIGFNQAAERFLMVDVGSGKEAADAKIKAYLEDNIRLPQTFKILFGGCHDNGYVASLRSLITAGFRDKLVLLPSYTELAAGIAELGLPAITIPNLFMTQKLITTSTSSTSAAQHAFGSTSRSDSGIASQMATTHISSTAPVTLLGLGLDYNVALNADDQTPQRPPCPPSYSSALQAIRERQPTPDLDQSGSSASSDCSDVPESLSLNSSPRTSQARHIDPNIPLTKHQPPPCTLFYLSHCNFGNKCKYSHDYLLEDEHYAEIRKNAKKVPCPAVNKGDTCLWGDACCYGHKCPFNKCHFFKQGRCKFVGADMHRANPEE